MYQKRMYAVIVSAFLILLSITFQGTYTYFVATTKNELESTGSALKSADLGNLVLAGNTSENFWIPGDTKEFPFTVTNTGTSPMCFKLYWKDIVNEFVNKNDLVVKLTTEDGTEIVGEMPFPSTDEEEPVLFAKEIQIPGKAEKEETGHTETYILIVTYKYTNQDQSEDMTKLFHATLTGSIGVCENTDGGGEDNPTQEEVFPDVVIGNLDEEGNGLVIQEHEESIQFQAGEEDFANSELRYIGKNPNNYVWFNCDTGYTSGSEHCEKWRIIGLVNVKTANGIEQRVKIVRNESIGNFSWDKEFNDWTKSTLMETLNGIYYNSTSGACYIKEESTCDFSSEQPIRGLSDTAKTMIDQEVIWNIGGMNGNDHISSEYYKQERGTLTGNNNQFPYEWSKENTKNSNGEATPTLYHGIGLIYLSDFVYATSGGNLGKETCLNINANSSGVGNGWNNYTECGENDWLNIYNWSITPYVVDYNGENLNGDVHYISSSGCVWPYPLNYDTAPTYPALYLKQNVVFLNTDGNDGSVDKPYILSLTE